VRGLLNDATSLYFTDATLASAFVARWCVGSKVETADGVLHMREDEPAPAGRGGVASDAVNGHHPPAVAYINECTRSGDHWNADPRPIIVQQRHEPEGFGRKRRRGG
jgi:hypothetical protein